MRRKEKKERTFHISPTHIIHAAGSGTVCSGSTKADGGGREGRDPRWLMWL